MFDIGFSELLLFGVIALIVLGPEKLPQAARTAGQWYAKLRRTVSTLQSEIEAELDLAETRQQMQKELAKIRETEAEMKREMAEMRGSMKEFEYSQNQSLKGQNKSQSAVQDEGATINSSEKKGFDKDSHKSAELIQKQPEPFVYAYERDVIFVEDDIEASSETDAINASLEDSDSLASTDTKNSADIKNGTDTASAIKPALVTKPWENMWFKLGSYDKARRLPAPPYLPNYRADKLLNSASNPTFLNKEEVNR